MVDEMRTPLRSELLWSCAVPDLLLPYNEGSLVVLVILTLLVILANYSVLSELSSAPRKGDPPLKRKEMMTRNRIHGFPSCGLIFLSLFVLP
jgi:hypothetical protein